MLSLYLWLSFWAVGRTGARLFFRRMGRLSTFRRPLCHLYSRGRQGMNLRRSRRRHRHDSPASMLVCLRGTWPRTVQLWPSGTWRQQKRCQDAAPLDVVFTHWCCPYRFCYQVMIIFSPKLDRCAEGRRSPRMKSSTKHAHIKCSTTGSLLPASSTGRKIAVVQVL